MTESPDPTRSDKTDNQQQIIGTKRQAEDSDATIVFESDIKGPTKHKKPRSATKLKHEKV